MGNKLSEMSNEDASDTNDMPGADEFEGFMGKMSNLSGLASLSQNIGSEKTGDIQNDLHTLNTLIESIKNMMGTINESTSERTPESVANYWISAIESAVLIKHLPHIEKAVSCGFDLNFTNKCGKTTLDLCKESGWVDGEQYVLKTLADPDYQQREKGGEAMLKLFDDRI